GKCRQDPAVICVAQMEFRANQRSERGQRLAIQIIDAGRKKENADDQPAVPQSGGRRTWHQGNWIVATSPTVAILALRLAKYSTRMRRGFCAPHPSFSSPPPRMATEDASGINSFVSW